jgi:hypothetical protein
MMLCPFCAGKLMSKTYDYKDLIDAHVKIPQRDYIHVDFRNYYTELVAKLEQLFEVKLLTPDSMPANYDSSHWPLWVLFENTVDAIRRSGVEGSGWIEGGPYASLWRLKESNPQADKAIVTLEDVRAKEAILKQQYRQLLYDLFAVFFGKTELRFTSADLLKIGFDDTKEPQLNEYDEYW